MSFSRPLSCQIGKRLAGFLIVLAIASVAPPPSYAFDPINNRIKTTSALLNTFFNNVTVGSSQLITDAQLNDPTPLFSRANTDVLILARTLASTEVTFTATAPQLNDTGRANIEKFLNEGGIVVTEFSSNTLWFTSRATFFNPTNDPSGLNVAIPALPNLAFPSTVTITGSKLTDFDCPVDLHTIVGSSSPIVAGIASPFRDDFCISPAPGAGDLHFNLQGDLAGNGILVVTVDSDETFGDTPTAIETIATARRGNGRAVMMLSDWQDLNSTDPAAIDADIGRLWVNVANLPLNSPPVANSQSITTQEDVAVTFNLSATDVETLAANLTYTIVSAPSHGTLSAGTGQVRTYTPDPNFNGTDSFTFTVTDRGSPDNCGAPSPSCAAPLTSAPATVTITVTPVNDAPTFTKGPDQTRFEDAGPQTVPFWATAISAGPADEAGQALTFLVSNDNNALFSAQPAVALNGTLTFTSAPNANGMATVTVTLKDDGGTANGGVDTSAPQTFTITVEPVNDPPVTTADSKSTAEDTPLSFPASDLTANDTPGPANESGQTLTVSAVSSPSTAGGTVALSAGTVTYSPAANFFGPDSFTYTVCDNGAPSLCATGTVNVTVNAVNDAPVASPQAVTTDEDTPKTITLKAEDIDNPSLTFHISIGPGPNHGSLGPVSASSCVPSGAGSICTATVVYTPAANYNGPDSFTFTASDGLLTSDPAAVTITVNAVNDAPVAVNDTATVAEDSGANTINVLANDSPGPASATDEASQTLTVTAVTQGTKGSVAIAPGGAPTWTQGSPSGIPPSARDAHTAVFHPATGRMTVFGGRTCTGTCTGAEFVALNDLWVLTDTSASAWTQLTPTGGPPAVRTFHSAVHDPATNRMIVFGGLNGPGTAVLHPMFNDVWVLSHADGVGGAPQWTQLSPGGGPPSPRGMHSAVYDQTTNRMIVFGGDPQIGFDGGAVNDVWVLSNANNTEATAPTWTQLIPSGTPPSARRLHSAVYDPTINRMIVFGGNNAGSPNTNDVWVLSNANNTEATAPTWTQLPSGTPPSARTGHSAVYDAGTNRMVVFGGAAPGLANDVWVLEHANGLGGTPTWTALSPTGGPPSARWLHSAVYSAGTNRMIVFGGSTATGLASDVWVLEGAVVPGGTAVTYTPNPNATGPDSFTYTVCDNGSPVQCATGTVNVTITPINDAPVANPDTATVAEDSAANTINVLANDTPGPASATDEASQSLTVNGDTQGAKGAVAIAAGGGSVTYTPNANATGPDSFTYQVCDNGSPVKCSTATVSVTITAVNDPPTFDPIADRIVNEDAGPQNDSITGISPGPADEAGQTVTLTATSSNPAIVPNPTVSAVSAGSATLTYQPAANANGTAEITVTANDGQAVNNTFQRTFAITVTAVNDPPFFNAIADQTVNEDAGPQNVSITGISPGPADEAGQTVTLTATSSNTLLIPNPTITGTGPSRTLTYQPVADRNGTATITVTADDGQTANNTFQRMFTITVTAVNDPPTFNAIADHIRDEDAGAQTVSITGVSPGPADEAGQTVTLTATSSNPAIVPHPTVSAVSAGSATLTYQPAANANGTATITVTAQDNGGTLNGGNDTFSRIFTITINAVNDPPVANPDTKSTSEDSSLAFPAGDLTANDTPGPPDEGGQTLTVTGVSLTSSAGGSVSLATTEGVWTAKAPMPVGRQQAAGGVINGQLYVAGGATTAAVTNTVEAYDPIADQWTAKAPMPGARTGAGAGAIGGKLYVAAGNDGVTGDTNTLQVYDAATDMWSFGAPVPVTGVAFASAVFNGKLYLAGGFAPGCQSLDTLWIYDPSSNTWSAGAPMLTRRNHAAGAFINGKLYVAGGGQTSFCGDPAGIPALTTLEIYDPTTNSWTTGAPMPEPRTSGPVAGAINGMLYVAGGHDGSARALATLAYNPTTNTWTTEAPIPTPREFPAGGVVNGTLYVVGGLADSGVVAANEAFTPAPAITYSPPPNFNGPDSFTYTVCDNGSPVLCATGTVNVTITPVNDAPVAGNDTATVAEDSGANTINVLANDTPGPATATDEAGQTLTVTAVTQGTKGSVAIAPGGGSVTYTPNANATGPDSFTYQVCDNGSPVKCSTATVSVTITAVNDPPAFNAIADQTVAEDASSQTVTITGVSPGPADEAAAGQTVTLTAVSSNTTVVPNPTITGTGATRTLTYQPVANANGTALITVTANDGQPVNNTFQRTFTITVNPVNDAPVAIAQSVTTGSPVTIVLNGTDLETAAENLTYTVVTGPTNGTLDPPAGMTGRIRTYTPSSGFSGTDSFTFTVTDGGDPDNCGPVSASCAGALSSPPATVSITVPASAGLTITKFANPSPVVTGATLTYTVTVRNLGPDGATGVTVTDVVPGGTAFAGVTPQCTAPAVGGTGTVSCSLGSLAAGATASITLTVNVRAAAGSTITNTATVSAATGDPNTADNSATTTTSVIAGSTTSTALSVPTILAPAAGGSPSAPQGLGNVQIDENVASSLDTLNRVELQLPADLTFSSVPAVSTVVSNGLTLVLSGSDGPRLDTPSRFSFKIASQSSGGTGGIILISNISVVVAPGFPPGPVLVTVNGPNTGITTTSVQNGTAVAPSNTPVLSGVSPTTAGQGTLATASRPLDGTIVLTGVNFNPDALVTFNPSTGITVNGLTVNSATQITAVIEVASGEPVDLLGRDVTVTNPGVVAGSSTLPGIFRVTAAPSVTDTDRHGTDAQNCSRGLFLGIFNQVVNIVATNVQSPPGISVEFGGLGISLVPGSIEQTLTGVKVRVDVGSALTTSLGAQAVTVINPDGGRGQGSITLSGPGGFVEIVDPPAPGSGCPGAEEGLAGGQGQGGPPTQNTQPAPTIASITPSSGFTATNVTISGSNFSTAANGNSVKFSGADAVTATSDGSSITVAVPATAVDGLVTVTNLSSGQVSNGVDFNVIDPKLTGVSPTSGEKGTTVSLNLSGSEFSGILDVRFSLPGETTQDINISVSVGTPTADGTTLPVSITILSTAATGLRDVTVTKTVSGVSRSSTLAGSFEVRAPATQGFNFEVVGLADASTYLPTVGAVSVTLGSNGQCTAKSITPQAVTLRATFFSSTGASPPSRVDVRITSVTTLRGTASTEDCEPPGASAINDFSITAASATTGTQNQILVERVSNSGGGTYDVKLWAWDWGGTVTVRVNDRANTAVASSITLPVDTDGDGLPNGYEANATLNADKNNNNVLNQTIFDQNANGTADGQDRFALDGLSNFEKYRRVCLKGPANGTTGPITDCIQLGAGIRNLFVRGRGFGDDPAITSGSTCGINPSTGAAVADSTACPPFAVGAAFANEGIKVHNVSASFTSTTVFPKVTMDPTKTAGTATLDMATVVYDAVGCASGETCDHTAKSGVRQWNFPTLGFSGFGSSTAYATDTKIFKKGVDAYFKDKPYEHRTNDPARVVTASDGRAMLAPITIVGDSSSQGSDNGVIDSGEATVAGQLAGDTYIANAFNKQLSAMDATNDGCVELPFVSDPTTLSTACDPAAETANPGPQATKKQVVRSLITHELGHALGINIHTTDSTDIMYEYTTNWTRDNHFSATAAGLIQIHNKGLQ